MTEKTYTDAWAQRMNVGKDAGLAFGILVLFGVFLWQTLQGQEQLNRSIHDSLEQGNETQRQQLTTSQELSRSFNRIADCTCREGSKP